jgi:hypothetical protein
MKAGQEKQHLNDEAFRTQAEGQKRNGRRNKYLEEEEYTDQFGRGHSDHEYPPKAGEFRNLSSI